jgi:RNA polymerase sigma factor (sigma-70 family)
MAGLEWVAEQFEGNRPRLEGIAQRMLGSRAEAEDAVQQAWFRVVGHDPAAVENFNGWLTTVTSRICLDRLKARRSLREQPVGADLPDVEDATAEHDPAQAAILAESVGAALLVVMDSMAPEERVAFVLHDVFAVPFDTIGEVVGRSSQAARQLASRARRRVQGTSPLANAEPAGHRTLVEAFLRAARQGDFEALVRLLHPDVVFQPDEAALTMGSLGEMRGARNVAAVLSAGARGILLVQVNGRSALAWGRGGQIRSIIQFSVVDNVVTRITVTADSQRLAGWDIVTMGP